MAAAELAVIAAPQIHMALRAVRENGVEVAKCHHIIPPATISDVTSTAPTIHIPKPRSWSRGAVTSGGSGWEGGAGWACSGVDVTSSPR